MRTLLPLLLSLFCASAQVPELYLLSWSAAVSGTTPPSSLVTNLVAFWRMDETSGTRDDCVSTNDLADNNTVTYTTGLITNSAYCVSNSLEYLSITDNTALSMENRSFTFVGWYKFYTSGGRQYLVGKYGGSNNREWFIRYDTDMSVDFGYCTNGNTSTIVTGPTAAATNTWYMVTGMFNCATMEAVSGLDTTLVTNVLAGCMAEDSTAEFRIGVITGLAQYYDGLVDEVGFWDRCLTYAEIQTLYNSGAGKTYPFQ